MRELTDFDSQRMHTQLIGRADFKDLVSHRELLRFRRINNILWVLFAVGTFITYGFWSIKNTKWAIIFAVVSIILLLALAVRYGWTRRLKKFKGRSRGNGWERIDRLPDWAYRKMKRRRTNRVNGDHYVYKREGNNFYRKKK